MTDWVETGHRVSLAGHVKDAQGLPVAKASVTIRQLGLVGGLVKQTLSAQDGSFWFEDLPDGDYEVAAKVGRGDAAGRGTTAVGLGGRRKETRTPKWIDVSVSA